MKKDVNKLLALGLAGMLMMGMTACGSEKNEQTDASNESDTSDTSDTDNGQEADTVTEEETEKEDGTEKTTITMSTFLTSDAQLEALEEYVVKAIEDKFPNVNFELQMSEKQGIMVEVAGGGGADILDLDGPTDVIQYAEAGKAVDMTPYAEKYNWKDVLADWAYNTCIYKDKLYSLPTAYEGTGMIYNLDVMEEHGWDIPQNLEEMEKWMEEAKNAGIMPIAFGNAGSQESVDHIYSTILSCMAGPEVVK